MQAALEDPSLVVGVTTGLSVRPVESVSSALDGLAPTGLVEAFRYLSAARTRLLTVGRRRLDLPPDGCPGFTIWRRDVVVDVGGLRRRRRRGARRHDPPDPRATTAAIGGAIASSTSPSRSALVDHDTARRHMVVAGYVPWSVLWRHKGIVFNPRLGRLGLFDFPRYAVQPGRGAVARTAGAGAAGRGHPARRADGRSAPAGALHPGPRQAASSR